MQQHGGGQPCSQRGQSHITLSPINNGKFHSELRQPAVSTKWEQTRVRWKRTCLTFSPNGKRMIWKRTTICVATITILTFFWPFAYSWTAPHYPHNDHYCVAWLGAYRRQWKRTEQNSPSLSPCLTFINGFIISRPWPVLPDRTALPWLSRKITANPDHEKSLSKSQGLRY